MPPRAQLSIPTPGSRRAVVIGAGSFGTATALLLARGGFRTTLQARAAEQCERLERDRENREYLPEVELPRELRIESMAAGLGRADYVFLGVPSRGLEEVIARLEPTGLARRTPVISLAKGLVAPDLGPDVGEREHGAAASSPRVTDPPGQPKSSRRSRPL